VQRLLAETAHEASILQGLLRLANRAQIAIVSSKREIAMSDNALTHTLDDTALDLLAEKVTSKLGEWLRLHRERLINIDELAERVGLSERGVRGLIKRNELPEGFEIGGCRRWDWGTVKKFLEGSKRKHRKRRGQYDREEAARRREECEGSVEGNTDGL
jgi:predicted DNA-binding transcriptional regulator AlpA